MYITIAIAAALLGADRVLKYLSRTGKLRLESKYLRLTHLENRGFFLGLGQKHEKLLRWLPMGVWLLAAVCPEEHRDLLMNVYEPVAAAALGLTLTEGPLDGLSQTQAGWAHLTDLLETPDLEKRRQTLEQAGERLARRLELGPQGRRGALRGPVPSPPPARPLTSFPGEFTFKQAMLLTPLPLSLLLRQHHL